MTATVAQGVHASGDTVVLLHSLGTDQSLWDAQAVALADAGYRVLTPESRGHGGNADPGPTNLGDWIADLHEVVTATNDPVHLAGLSMGGVQALAYTLTHPEEVRSLVLADTFAALDATSAETKIDGIRAAVTAHGMTAYARTYLDETLTVALDADRRDRLRASIAGVSAAAYLSSAEVCFRATLADRSARYGPPPWSSWAATTTRPRSRCPRHCIVASRDLG